MGFIMYDSTSQLYIEDRALAHLKVVIATKLRRNESFTVSWTHAEGDAYGRSTIWLHPSIPLRFTFEGREAPKLNPQWIDELMQSANATGGIQLVDEVVQGAAPE
ncbi:MULTISPECIES: DUF7882 family protein [Microbacterium]|uniref:DUF7882 family protein n=1 Tax=Microbacterium TaxID=33882 RepID=UPI0011EADD3F|nr:MULTISPECIES: hypothetical protein [Microbacterium]